MKIAPAKIVYAEDEKRSILAKFSDILDSGQVILGKHTKEFEGLFAQYTGKKHAVALANDTAALEIHLRYLKKTLPPHKKEVVLPATSFFSCLIAIEDAGFKARIVDSTVANGIHPTAEQIGEAITEKTACVMTVYTGGYLPYDLAKIRKVCDEMGVPLLEDAAHCHGSTLDGKPAGSFGDAAGFSFYATKVLNTMEGGLLLTDDEGLANYARTMRNYGRVADFQRSLAGEWGNNWRMTEVQAVIGVEQSLRIEAIVGERNRVARMYDDALSGFPKLKDFANKVPYPKNMRHNYYRYIMVLDDVLGNKEFIRSELQERGITLPGDTYEQTLNRQPIFASLYGHLTFKEAEHYCSRHLGLPIYAGMTSEEVLFVVDNWASVILGRT